MANRETEVCAPLGVARGHIPVLDGVRGLAILMVLCSHFGGAAPRVRLDRAYLTVTGFGWCGVDVFFVLSGFLITGILVDSRDDPHHFRNFYARRSLRIFPLYYGALACLALGLLALRLPQPVHGGWYWVYASNIMQTVTWRPGSNGDPLVYGHFWTLAVEEHFYLVWPLLMYVAGRRGRYLTCLAFLVAAPMCRVLMWKVSHNPIGAFMLTPCRVDSLAAGGLLALALRDRPVFDALNRHRRMIAPLALATAVVLVGVLVWSGDTLWFRRHTEVVGFSLIDLLATLLILGLLLARPDRLAHRALNARWLRSVGKYSYGIYILHDISGPPVVRHLYRIPALARCPSIIPGSVLAIVAGSAVAYAGAWVSYHGFERHFLKLKSRFAGPRRPGASDAPRRSVGPAAETAGVVAPT